jgi:hypothetical protein
MASLDGPAQAAAAPSGTPACCCRRILKSIRSSSRAQFRLISFEFSTFTGIRAASWRAHMNHMAGLAPLIFVSVARARRSLGAAGERR